MAVISEEKLSDSPFVDTIWYTRAISDGTDIVTADVSWDMLIINRDGKANVSMWGPMTKTAQISHTEGQDCLGIRFKVGTFMPFMSADKMLDQGIILAEASGQNFWLGSSAWELPNYENVDTFLERLARGGLLTSNPLVEAVLQGEAHETEASLRSVQRHFVRTTGLTPSYIRFIERAQKAASLLKQGVSILDVVYTLDYSDQAHLTKSLKRLIGQTPAQILIKTE